MAPPSRFGWLSLAAIFVLFLSLLNIATASPLPDNQVNTLVARGRSPSPALKNISKERYQSYLKKYFPATDKYLFYSGGAEDQVKAFIAANPSYEYYATLYNAPSASHPWYKAFDETKDEDDADAASKAMANTVTGTVLVFGAIEYKTAGKTSFFTTKEIKRLHKRMKTGSITSIHHMAKGATKPSQVMAIEDADGNFTWQKGYKEGDKNASGAYGSCSALKRALGRCDAPKIKAKKLNSCKRGVGSKGAACPMKKPSSTAPTSTAAKKAAAKKAAAKKPKAKKPKAKKPKAKKPKAKKSKAKKPKKTL